MPKNDKTDKNVNATADAENVTPATATVDSTETPVTTRSTRRLGTGAIIGISAAGVALIAGVFGGGIALGAGISHDSRGDMARNASDASGQGDGDRMQGDRMQGDRMHGGPMQGGPMQGGSIQGGPGQDHDSDGPMMGDLPALPSQTGETSAPTPSPSN